MIREQHMPLVEERSARIERAAPLNQGGGDYRAVISQIKQEILVEISGRPSQTSPTLHSVPDAKLKSLLEQVQLEAGRRGLTENYYDKPEPPRVRLMFRKCCWQCFCSPPPPGKGWKEFWPKLPWGGLELLEKAKDNIAVMMRDELF